MEDNYYLHNLSEEDKKEWQQRLMKKIIQVANYISNNKKEKINYERF